MPTFVHISEGPSPDVAEDRVVILNPELVKAIGVLIARSLGAVPPRVVPLRPEERES